MGYETPEYRLVNGLARGRIRCERQTADEPLWLESKQPRRSGQGSRIPEESQRRVPLAPRRQTVGCLRAALAETLCRGKIRGQRLRLPGSFSRDVGMRRRRERVVPALYRRGVGFG